MQTFLTILHIFVTVVLILIVLVQSGRSGGVGAAFGSASSQVFGGRGASHFLSRVTTVAAIVFFLTSLSLSVMSSRHRSVVAEAQAADGRAAIQETAAEETGAEGATSEAADSAANSESQDNAPAEDAGEAPDEASESNTSSTAEP